MKKDRTFFGINTLHRKPEVKFVVENPLKPNRKARRTKLRGEGK